MSTYNNNYWDLYFSDPNSEYVPYYLKSNTLLNIPIYKHNLDTINPITPLPTDQELHQGVQSVDVSSYINPTKPKNRFLKNLIDNYDTYNAGLNVANTLFKGVFGNKYGNDGKYNNVALGIDAGLNIVQQSAPMLFPAGTLVSLGIGANNLVSNVINSFVGTDNMTLLDTIFSKIAPLALVNGLGRSKSDTITKDKQTFELVGTDYTGTDLVVDDALAESGKYFGTFSKGALRETNENIANANNQQKDVRYVAKKSTDRRLLSLSMSAINGNRREYEMNGWNLWGTLVGRNGMKLDLMAKAKLILHTPTEIEIVVPEYQEGGLINKKSRNLLELITYAKEVNPRFIQRFSEPSKGIDFIDDNGVKSYGSHYMEWSTDDKGNAIVYPRIQEVDKELKFFNSKDAYDRALETNNYLVMTPEEANTFFAEDSEYGVAYKSGWPLFFDKFLNGGSINVIPDGALHARKHNMDIKGITKKGIPVVDNKGEQQAEVECGEIILRLEVTLKLEDLGKQFKESKDNNLALEAGKMLINEILYNTLDNTNKLL